MAAGADSTDISEWTMPIEGSVEIDTSSDKWYYFFESLHGSVVNGLGCRVFPPEYRRDPFVILDLSVRDIEWREGSRALILFCPGLGDRPGVFGFNIDTLRERVGDKIDIKVVENVNDGNASLQECTERVVEVVRGYCETHEENPVCLLGVSNGGRIVSSAEHLLRNTVKKVHVIAIGTPFMGTAFLDDSHGVTEWWKERLHSSFSDRISFSSLIDEGKFERHRLGSKEGRDLITRMREELPEGCERSYLFAASYHDGLIYPIRTSFPDLPGKRVEVLTAEALSHLCLLSGPIREKAFSSMETFLKSTGALPAE